MSTRPRSTGSPTGRVPFWEPGLDEILARNLATGRLRFTTSYAEAAEFGDVHFIGVGTPQKKGEFAADVSALDSVIDDLRRCSPARRSSPASRRCPSAPPPGWRRASASSHPPARTSSSAGTPSSCARASRSRTRCTPTGWCSDSRPARPYAPKASCAQVYAPMLEANTPLIVTDLATAELVKVSANAFLATKISFINAISEVCETVGADVTTLADAIGHDARIGRTIPQCWPRFRRRLPAQGHPRLHGPRRRARHGPRLPSRGRPRSTCVSASGWSLLPRRLAAERFSASASVSSGRRSSPNSDDIRDSPALNVAGQMQLQGAQVSVYDPKAMDNARKLFPTLSYADSVIDAAKSADVVLHLTEWREFRELDPTSLGEVVSEKYVVDARNALDREAWRAAGWTYRGLGRP